MTQIIVEKFDGGLWKATDHGEIVDDSDAEGRCVKLLAELYIAMHFNILDYRCQFLGDGGKVVTVTPSHPDFNEACDEEREAEMERAAEHKADERSGR